MPVIFCLSASAKPRGRKRRALRSWEQTPVGNYLSHRLGQWAAAQRLLQLKQPQLQLQVSARAFDEGLACSPGPANGPTGSWPQDKG